MSSKEVNDKDIKYKNIKWWDVNKLISDDNKIITTNFSKYLSENTIITG